MATSRNWRGKDKEVSGRQVLGPRAEEQTPCCGVGSWGQVAADEGFGDR